MRLEEIFETDFSVRKTVWSKRGDHITRREVDARAATDLPTRTKIKVEPQKDAD